MELLQLLLEGGLHLLLHLLLHQSQLLVVVAYVSVLPITLVPGSALQVALLSRESQVWRLWFTGS